MGEKHIRVIAKMHDTLSHEFYMKDDATISDVIKEIIKIELGRKGMTKYLFEKLDLCIRIEDYIYDAFKHIDGHKYRPVSNHFKVRDFIGDQASATFIVR